MYRDTVGKVTVGVGLMLPDVKAAQELPFIMGTRPATPQEIAAEFARVDGLPLGRASSFYKTPASLELTQQTIDAKLSSVLKGFETDLRIQFPRYDLLPDADKDRAARPDLQPRPHRSVPRIPSPRRGSRGRSVGTGRRTLHASRSQCRP